MITLVALVQMVFEYMQMVFEYPKCLSYKPSFEYVNLNRKLLACFINFLKLNPEAFFIYEGII